MAHPTNEHQEHHVPECIHSDVPAAGDHRSPQFDKVTGRARHGCKCASSRGDSNASADGGGRTESVAPSLVTDGFSDTSSDAGDFVDGQEGVEEERFWNQKHGWMSLRDILAKVNCRCYRSYAPLENEQYYGIASLSSSGYLPGDSAMADAGSENPSMATSFHTSATEIIAPDSAALLHGVGSGMHVTNAMTNGIHLNQSPLRLSQEPEHCSNMVIGSFGLIAPYPLELSFCDEGDDRHGRFELYDIW